MDGMPKVILLVKVESAYDRRLLVGVSNYAHLHGPWAIFHEIEESKRSLDFVMNWEADGIIADVREIEKKNPILEQNIPTITIGSRISTFDSQIENLYPNISSNSKKIGTMGAEHFLERCFKNFAFCGYNNFAWSVNRRKFFEKALKKAGFECLFLNQNYHSTDTSWKKVQENLAKWIKSLPKPIGIMTCNDYLGRRILEACQLANTSVPDQVSVLGVDNDEIACNLTYPPLSSISINSEKAGYKASEFLSDLMSGKEVMSRQKIIAEPTHIEVRKSTDFLAINDSEVAQAIRYIRNNTNKSIQVENVAEVAGLSRRSLHSRFKKAIGLSVSGEIRKSKIEHIERMLIDTNLSIAQVALAMGYSGIEKLSRFFTREKGVTPSEFRKKYQIR